MIPSLSLFRPCRPAFPVSLLLFLGFGNHMVQMKVIWTSEDILADFPLKTCLNNIILFIHNYTATAICLLNIYTYDCVCFYGDECCVWQV